MEEVQTTVPTMVPVAPAPPPNVEADGRGPPPQKRLRKSAVKDKNINDQGKGGVDTAPAAKGSKKDPSGHDGDADGSAGGPAAVWAGASFRFH